MADRILASASSLGQSTYNADTAYQTKTSVSHTPNASTNVLYLFSALANGSSTSSI